MSACVGGVFVAGALQQDSETSGMILGLRKPTRSPQPLPSSISYRGQPRQASPCWSLVRTGWGGVGWGGGRPWKGRPENHSGREQLSKGILCFGNPRERVMAADNAGSEAGSGAEEALLMTSLEKSQL